MTENFADRLIAAIEAKQSQVCVGLDPRLEQLPPFLRDRYSARVGCGGVQQAVASCFEEFCTAIIDAVAPQAAAIKFQLACFEQYGSAGIRAFERLCQWAAASGLLVIADAKRGDIGISAQAYAAAFLGRPPGFAGPLPGFDADALTVNPYFGSDGMNPFLADCQNYGKGIFVLVKTSNPTSAQLQDLTVAADDGFGDRLYQKVAGLVDGWGESLIGSEGYSSIGAVVGATQVRALTELRRLMPRTFLLLPGYGAQGAGVEDVLSAFDSQGRGALITASRSIIYAGSGADYAQAAAQAAAEMRSELWRATRG